MSAALPFRPGGHRPEGRRRSVLGALLVATVVLSGCSTAAAPASGGTPPATSSAPRSGYLVYWDQDEEVDYYS